jgi:hypothetical protein
MATNYDGSLQTGASALAGRGKIISDETSGARAGAPRTCRSPCLCADWRHARRMTTGSVWSIAEGSGAKNEDLNERGVKSRHHQFWRQILILRQFGAG